MNLVDEKDIMLPQIRQQRDKIPLPLESGAGGHPDLHPHFIGDDLGQRRFAEARRTVKQGVVERLSAPAGGLKKNRKVFLGLLLPDVFIQGLWAERKLCFAVLRGIFRHDDAVFKIGLVIAEQGSSPFPLYM